MLGQPADVSSDARAREIRRCAKCGQPEARCVHVTVHLYRGIIPYGRTYHHTCAACSAEFQTLSALRIGIEAVTGTIMVPVGLSLALIALNGGGRA